MTGRATFGDFLQAAHRHLDPPPGTIGQPPARGDAGEVSQSLLRVLTVMGRYLRDLATAFDGLPTGTSSFTQLFAQLPAGGGKMHDLVIGAKQLSDSALIKIAASGLST